MNIEEFLTKAQADKESLEEEHVVDDIQEHPETGSDESDIGEIELDVQKAVVEELATEKANLEETCQQQAKKIEELRERIEGLTARINQLEKDLDAKDARCYSLNLEKTKAEKEATACRNQLAEVGARLADIQEKQFDIQSRNPNALALLDREVELPDRFPGETRDHVIEVVREARDKAEADGRVRRAQLLEGVLVANEPNGNLEKKRAALEKFFNENGNILSGPVLEELDKYGIPYKKGEEYLLPSEILRRMY